MDELFRFSITRPAQRTDAVTLPLKRGNGTIFQNVLQSIATAEATRHQWRPLQDEALAFIERNQESIRTLHDKPLVQTLTKLLADLQEDLQTAQPAKWLALIRSAVTAANAAGSVDPGKIGTILGLEPADLFLALLIFRSIGPAQIDKVVRARSLFPLAELLHDRPSLNEIADLLRIISLLQSPLESLKTADDVRAALIKTLVLPPNIFSEFEKPVHAVGITDLLVVKQHIHHYELGEIARIENVLKGETRDHSQKHTLSNERDTFFQTEKETVTDQELTSTDRVNIKNEIENTLKEDTKIDAGVHLQYDGGGSFKVQTDLTVAYDRSSTESKKFASEIAKEVTQKAAKKVTERVQQSVTTKVIETFEELEDQKFENKSGPHVSGVYQWVEKVYLAQVFNYGIHMLFDIMVPEPAASLLKAAEVVPKNQKPPTPPRPLGTEKKDPLTGQPILDQALGPEQLLEGPATDPNFYGRWIAKFQVTGVEPPPPETITVAKGFSEKASDEQVHGQATINLEDGYAAYSCSVAVAWRCTGGGDAKDESRVDVIVGPRLIPFSRTQNTSLDVKERNFTGLVQDEPLEKDANGVPHGLEQRSIGIALETIRSEAMTANIEVKCKRTAELFAKWQLQTYEKIAARWQKLQADYEDKLAALQFEKGPTGLLGAADPESNRQIERTELKRACIAILDNNNATVQGEPPNVAVKNYPTTTEVATLGGTSAPGPRETPLQLPEPVLVPTPNLMLAEDLGTNVRWFEQAFEWDKIGYVFYPYFWGRRTEWVHRLNLKNDDPLFENFLRAGYARVVVPVRNGFEDAVNFFMLTGIPWLGGGLPKIWEQGNNPLYLSIVEEIKEQTGAPGRETPSEQPPWFIRLPTRLIRLRPDDLLPTWTRAGKNSEPPLDAWSWTGDEPPKPTSRVN